MKFLKLNTMTKLLTCLFFIFLSTNLFAQNDKMIQRANERVEEINSLIISEDKALALTETQKSTMKDLFAQKMKALVAFNKSDEKDSKEARNAFQKKHNVKIFNETMSKKQLTAFYNARKKKNKK